MFLHPRKSRDVIYMYICANFYTAELLRVMGYERDGTVVPTRKSIRLRMCDQIVSAQTVGRLSHGHYL